MNKGTVISVSSSDTHTFNKYKKDKIKLITGLGVEGDAHMGKYVKHRSRVAKDSMKPNLRQVHLIHSELFDELRSKGFEVLPAQMGENITTRGIDLLKLPKDTILHFGNTKIQITGLRNPCSQINSIQKGLMNELVGKDEEGNIIRKAGIMAVVMEGGEISTGDTIEIQLPEKPYQKLEKV